MIYSFSISAYPYTGNLVTYERKLKLTMGVIHQVDLIIPPGANGFVFCAIYNGLHQVWPSNPDEYFNGDDVNISFKEHLPLLTEPFELTARVWNIDDTFTHTITIRLGILPIQDIAPWLQSYDEKLRAILGG